MNEGLPRLPDRGIGVGPIMPEVWSAQSGDDAVWVRLWPRVPRGRAFGCAGVLGGAGVV